MDRGKIPDLAARDNKIYLDLKDIIKENAVPFLPAKSLFAHNQSLSCHSTSGILIQIHRGSPSPIPIDANSCGCQIQFLASCLSLLTLNPPPMDCFAAEVVKGTRPATYVIPLLSSGRNYQNQMLIMDQILVRQLNLIYIPLERVLGRLLGRYALEIEQYFKNQGSM